MKKKAPPRAYTDEELVQRAWDIEEIKKVAYKRSLYLAAERRQEELDDLWVTEPQARETAAFGRNTGWYVGMDAITDYYVKKHRQDRWRELEELHQNDPSIALSEENLHIGCLTSHPLTTGLVELAGDGQTAKALFYSVAQDTNALPDGTARVLWVPEKLAFDLRKESGGWKIWHLVIASDLYCEAGEDYKKRSCYPDYDTDPVILEFGTPTVPELLHDQTFNWWDDYPFVPDPYESWSDEISYGPEGWAPPECYALHAREGGNYKWKS